jgi:hypothetical protein
LEQYGAEVEMDSFHALLYYLLRDFRRYGKVDPLFHDPHIEDISCDGYDLPIFVYHDRHTDIKTNVSFGPEELDNYVTRLAQRSGNHVSVGEPIVGTTLPNGARVELTLGEEVTHDPEVRRGAVHAGGPDRVRHLLRRADGVLLAVYRTQQESHLRGRHRLRQDHLDERGVDVHPAAVEGAHDRGHAGTLLVPRQLAVVGDA